MDRGQAKNLLSVIEAYVNGKTIQARVRGTNEWFDEFNPSFEPRFQYRIKPEPREWWVVEPGGGEAFLYTSKEVAENSMVKRLVENSFFGRARCFRVREVTEE